MPRPNKGPQLRPNKKREGTYYIYWTDETGRSRERSTGTSDSIRAHEIFAGWLAQRGPEPWSGPRRPHEAGIADVIAMYAHEHVAERVASRVNTGYMIKSLLDWWGEMACDAILPETCRAYIRARSATVKETTAGRELGILRAAINHAHKNGRLLNPPFVESVGRGPGRDRWLTRSEAAALLWESRREPKSRDHLPLFILLALATGARPGAALFGLRWTQIDFDRDRIDFNPKGRRQTTKIRPTIPIPRRLRWFLLRAHARATSPYVLSYNGKPLGSVKKAFHAARRRAGLGPEVIPYVLRHTCATWMAQEGVDLRIIGGWLGHSLQRTTELYAKHHPDHLAPARRVMD